MKLMINKELFVFVECDDVVATNNTSQRQLRGDAMARKTGRSAETIRYTLKQFDQEHPEIAVFPDSHGPLRPETRRRGVEFVQAASRFRGNPAALCPDFGDSYFFFYVFSNIVVDSGFHNLP